MEHSALDLMLAFFASIIELRLEYLALKLLFNDRKYALSVRDREDGVAQEKSAKHLWVQLVN